MPTFVARPSKIRLGLLLLGSLGFVALGLWIAGIFGSPPAPEKIGWGWASIAFFGLCSIVIARRLADDGDQVTIGPAGIFSKQWSDQTILWSDIVDVSVWEYRRQKSIILKLKDPSRYPSTTVLGKLAAANRMLTGGDLPISLTGTDGQFDDAMAAINYFWPKR